MTLERQTEKVLRVAEALLRPPLGALFPGPGELANWDLHARLEGVLTRALQRGDATAPAAPSAQPVPAATRESGSRPDFRSTANAFPPAASPASAFAGLFDTPSAQAPLDAPLRWPAAPSRSSPARALESAAPRANTALAGLEPAGRAAPLPSPFSPLGTVARNPGVPSVPASGTGTLGAPSPAVSSPAAAARPVAPRPLPELARTTFTTTAAHSAPPPPSVPEPTLFHAGPSAAASGGAPGPRALRLVSTPTELAALLQSHVSAPEGAGPTPAALDAAAREVALPAPSSALVSPDVLAPAPPPLSLPEVSFPAVARERGTSGAAEELLLDKLLDRFQDRLREDSIRRFGLGGGDL